MSASHYVWAAGLAASITLLPVRGLATLGAQDQPTVFAQQVDALIEAAPEEQWQAVERGIWQQELDLPLALLDRLGPASGAWAPALRAVLDEEHPKTFWPALEVLAHVDVWAEEPTDAARFTVDDDRIERLAVRARGRGLRVVSPSGARARIEFAALVRNSRGKVDPSLSSAELGRWLSFRPSDPFAVQCAAQTLAARGPAAADALPGLLQALDGSLEETRFAQGLSTAQIPATVRSVARAVRRIAPDDPRAEPAWLFTLCDTEAPVPDVLAAKAALLAHPPEPARANAALVRCVDSASREPQTLAAIEVLDSLGAGALPAASGLLERAARGAPESACASAAREAARRILDAACLGWLGPNPSARERTRSLRIRQQVDELLDAYLVATDAAEGDELFERLAGFGVFTSQALVDRVFRGGAAPAAISRGTPAGRLLAPLIARLGTAHAAVLPRIEAELRRNDPLTQLWALDLFLRVGPWSGRVTPDSVPGLEELDLQEAQLAWEGPEIDRRILTQRVEQQRAYVGSFLSVTRQRFAIRVDGPVHGLLDLLRSRSPMEVEIGARALALAEPEAAAAAVPLIRELRSGHWSKYEPVDALDQNFWIHADTALDELWIQLAPPSRDHETLVQRSIARADRHPLELARICAWLGAAPTTSGEGSEVPQLLLNRVLQHGCRFGAEESLRPTLAALAARLEREPLVDEVRRQIESSLQGDQVPDSAVPALEALLRKRE